MQLGSDLSFDEHLLDAPDRLGWVEALGTGLGAVHDRVAAIELERVLERIKTLTRVLVARIGNPAIRLQKHRWAEIALPVPPVARAARRAAEAQNALPQPVELRPLLAALQAL